jgi:8-oxo-dGTP diphosphatase
MKKDKGLLFSQRLVPKLQDKIKELQKGKKDSNKFRKAAVASIWFHNKIMLCQVVKECWHKGLYSNAGGKVENNETPLEAIQREVHEETGLFLNKSDFHIIDCFVYPEKELKTFLFEVKLAPFRFRFVKNIEPTKQSDWKLYSKKEALKLKLLPSLRHYLEYLKY